tara:strand:- start:183 stop:371 length:189 start_codon:yes stop_codon:yes gene_type:complete
MNELDHRDEMDRALEDRFDPAKGIIYGLIFGVLFWVIVIGGCVAVQKLSGNDQPIEQTEGTR